MELELYLNMNPVVAGLMFMFIALTIIIIGTIKYENNEEGDD